MIVIDGQANGQGNETLELVGQCTPKRKPPEKPDVSKSPHVKAVQAFDPASDSKVAILPY